MRRVFLILVLLAIISCMKFHHEMKHRKRHGFRHKLHELRSCSKLLVAMAIGTTTEKTFPIWR